MFEKIKKYFNKEKIFALEMQILDYSLKNNVDFWEAVELLPEAYERLISLKRSAR